MMLYMADAYQGDIFRKAHWGIASVLRYLVDDKEKDWGSL